VEEERVRVGKSTNLLLLQAQRDRDQALLNGAAARIAYRRALVGLYRGDGSLLARRGVQVAP